MWGSGEEVLPKPFPNFEGKKATSAMALNSLARWAPMYIPMYMNAIYASSQNEIRKVYFHIKSSYKVVCIILSKYRI